MVTLIQEMMRLGVYVVWEIIYFTSEALFEWFHETITYPTIKIIRKKINPLTTEKTQEGSIPSDQEACMLGGSDIPYLQQMTSPELVKASVSRGMFFAKIGAKITEMSQPLDLRPYFKILKVSGRQMTSVGTETSISILVAIQCKELRKNKQLMVSALTQSALKDCITTTPDMIAADFLKCSIIDYFVSSGIDKS